MLVPKSRLSLNKAHVVGTFHCASEKSGETHCPQGIDAIEFRLDLLKRLPSPDELRVYKEPFIMTCRHAEEGGAPDLSQQERLQLFLEAVPHASFVDLELRFWNEVTPVQELAQKTGVGIIASFHDFLSTPPLSELLEKCFAARKLGADILKVATYLKKPSDLATLLQLIDGAPLPIAAMGMGPLGMASRLVLARCGSVLNYGWLIRPFVSGQWPAEKFAERLKEL